MLKSILFIYLALGGYAYFFADRMIFQPQPASYQDQPDTLKLTTSDGVQITALYLPNPKATYTILYSHGNAEDLGDSRSTLEALHSTGFAVLSYDYRGYGTSPGSASEQTTYQDINAAYEYLTTTLHIPPDRIIVYGRSVGSGPSVDLASRVPIAGLILENAFTTTFRVITRIPIFPFDRFDNLSKIGRVNCPVLIIHGSADRVIPLHHGQTLYHHANHPKQWVVIEGAGHNDLMAVAGSEYVQILQTFIQQLRPPATPANPKKSPT
ncbi:alpha/beta hydrolase [Pantanalinema rosaneae]|uniref:alpha/beta hydrolase n=1 Tax=Pantanalinema rosaneae TaxID=1620701 RepID=UPI003D701626